MSISTGAVISASVLTFFHFLNSNRMKRFFLLGIVLLIAGIYSVSTQANISKNEAYKVVAKNVKESQNEMWLSNKPFRIGDTLSLWNGFLVCPFEEAWGVFIDNQPLNNWGHECQYIFVNISNGEQKCFNRTSPPHKISEYWTKYKSIYPIVTKDTTKTNLFLRQLRQTTRNQRTHEGLNVINQESSNIYAIIIDYCGSYPEYNHERLWNDCSAMYSTLRNNGYPRDHIYVAMPDSSFELHLASGAFIPTPQDLDGDGLNDIGYEASVNGINDLFQDISNVLTEDDILLVYLTGHGNAVYDFSSTYFGVVMGENDMYTDNTLFQRLSALNASILNLIVQRNYTHYFTHSDTILYNHASYQTVISCVDFPTTDSLDSLLFDPYTFHWLTAVNDGDLQADINSDGYISMYEAHSYATANSPYIGSPYMPKQNSKPICLKHDLTLINTILNDPCIASDLCIRDNTSDLGAEPNTSTSLSYISPDIWITDLNGNVVTTLMSNETYNVCVKVKNVGSENSYGNEVLHLHWVKAVIGGQWPDSWIEGSVYDCNGTFVNPGGEITPLEGWSIPIIPPGMEYVVSVPWTTPNNADYTVCSEFTDNIEQLWHYCLLARLYENNDTPGSDLTYQPFNEFVLNSNNVASRNITIMSEVENNVLASTVGLIAPYEGFFSLQCRLYINFENFFSNNFTINIYTDDEILSGWSGYSNGFLNLENKFQLIAPIAELQQIYLRNDALHSIYVEIEDGAQYDILMDIALTDTNGIVVGGEHFQYTPEISTLNRAFLIKNSDNEFTISQQSLNDIERVLVINATGQVITQCSDVYTIDMNKLPQGIYTIVVEDKEGIKTYKVIR